MRAELEELVRLLGARTTSVQEWAAYALRKACSRSSFLTRLAFDTFLHGEVCATHSARAAIIAAAILVE